MANVGKPLRFVLSFLSCTSCVFLLFIFPMFAILTSAIVRIFSIFSGNPRIFELADDHIIEFCERLIVFCTETVCPHEIVLHGHTRALDFLAERQTDRVIYISNHTAAADWIIAEILALRAKALPRLRFVMKNSLRYSPLYGWFLRQRNCIYVKRGGGERESFRSQVSRLGPGGLFSPGAWLIIFPEGTRIKDPAKYPKVLAHNQEYAASKGLKTYQYHLTPKHRGLYLCVEGLTGRGSDKDTCWLLNATVLYEPRGDSRSDWKWQACNDPQNQLRRPAATSIIGLLTGAAHRIHVYLELISLNDQLPGDRTQSYRVSKPPTDEPSFAKWLEKIYSDKDELIGKVLSSLQKNRQVSFGQGVSMRVLAKPWGETIPHAMLAYALLFLYFIKAGFWIFICQYSLESILCWLSLALIADESAFK